MRALRGITGVAAAALLSGCAAAPALTSPAGTVTGRLQIEGGPIGPGGQQPGKRGVPGTVQFTAGRRRLLTVRVGSSGTFSVRLPAGNYAVCGRSPDLVEVRSGAGRQAPCSQPQPVAVTARHTTRIAITFDVP